MMGINVYWVHGNISKRVRSSSVLLLWRLSERYLQWWSILSQHNSSVVYYCTFLLLWELRQQVFTKQGLLSIITMMMTITTINERERGHSYRKKLHCNFFFQIQSSSIFVSLFNYKAGGFLPEVVCELKNVRA